MVTIVIGGAVGVSRLKADQYLPVRSVVTPVMTIVVVVATGEVYE